MLPKFLNSEKTLFAIFVIGFFLLINTTSAINFIATEESCEQPEIEKECNKIGEEKCKEVMQLCVDYYDTKAKYFDSESKKYGGEVKSLNGQIGNIESRIKSLNNQMYKNNLMITDLSSQVESTKKSIVETSDQIEDVKDRMENIIKSVYILDQRSIVELFLSGESLMDAFDKYIALKKFSLKNEALVIDALKLKTNLQSQKINLGGQKEKLQGQVSEQAVKRSQESSLKTQKAVILEETKGKEHLFNNYKLGAEAEAQKIREQIFKLAGISGTSEAPSFGEAIELAKMVGGKIGVRPAFILGILAQETRIGKVLGGCYVTDPSGSGNMNPNQVQAFITICTEAGLNYKEMPISCPAPHVGCKYGGAMGPAQFIPTTWMLFRNQVATYVGHKANPWNVTDAFYANALFLKDAGATASGYGEANAAARYFGTGAYGYPAGVKSRADCIQSFIDTGAMSIACQNMIF